MSIEFCFFVLFVGGISFFSEVRFWSSRRELNATGNKPKNLFKK